MEEKVDTIFLNACLDRMLAGDREAQNQLLRAVCDRLERLSRKMLQKFPGVERWTSSEDVLQNSTLRLLRALEQVRPASVRDFFGLAAEQMRRELLDMARYFRGPMGGNLYRSGGLGDASGRCIEPPAPDPSDSEFDDWESFHTAVDRLPTEEREIVALIFYHGWTQAQVAELFQVSERTVRRRWVEASIKIRQAMNANMSDSSF